MRIVVIGVGVLGTLYASRLARSGNEVVVVARSARAAEIREHGLVVVDEGRGRRTSTQVEVVEGLDPGLQADLTLVLVRGEQVADLLPDLAAAPRLASVVFMSNRAGGPDELVRSVGAARTLLGFPGAGGTREGVGVRARVLPGAFQPTMIGELDGQLTSRVQRIAATLRGAGFPVSVDRDMDAWLKTHVAVVSPAACAIYAAGGTTHRLAATPAALDLMIGGVREGLSVLRSLGVPIVPARYRLAQAVPVALLRAILARALATDRAELVMARHAGAARTEMAFLQRDFGRLVADSGLATPALDRLAGWLDPAKPPLPTGSASGRIERPGLRRRRLFGLGAAVTAVVIGARIGRRGGGARRDARLRSQAG